MSCSEAQSTLAGQALKTIFKMNKYLNNYTDIKISHHLDLFDKLMSPILNYGSEVPGLVRGDAIEKLHEQFCKKNLVLKKSAQNDFIYRELGRYTFRIDNFILYWIKIIQTNENCV